MANAFTPEQQKRMVATYNRAPLPEPAIDLSCTPLWYTAEQMHAYSDAENAALQAELLREHADHEQTVHDALLVLLENRTLIEKVRVLREALEEALPDIEHATRRTYDGTGGYMKRDRAAALLARALAALEATK